MRSGRLVACLLVAGLAAACGQSDGPEGLEGGVESGPPINYTVTFPPDLPPEVASLLPQASQAKEGEARPPTNELVLRNRAQGDLARLTSALQSLGYYEPRVSYEIVRPPTAAGAEAPPVEIRFSVEPGPLFRFASLAIVVDGEAPGYQPPTPQDLGLIAGQSAAAQVVLDADQELLRRARQAGFALAQQQRRSTVIDSPARTMDVTLRIAPGRRATFGPVTFNGADEVERDFLRNRLAFEEGQRFDPMKVQESQNDLYDTNLFATIILNEADELTPEGALPITVELRQRAARSIGARLGYDTDIGPNTELFWENRNILGAGERLRIETELALPRQQLSTNFTKPDFLRRDQSLIANANLRNEDLDAYKSQTIGAGIGIDRMITERLTVGLGVAYRYAAIEDRDLEEEKFGLLSLPGRVDWDFSDNELDPSRGGRLNIAAAPFYDTLGTAGSFLKAQVTHSRYFTLIDNPRLVFAARASLGSIIGTAREDLPADERFYAGGGGSVRGIPYQLAGPLDDDDDPLGGKSLIELGGELRYKITDTIGVVGFLDAGTVATESYPTFSEELRLGAGPGIRYFTPIGPLRVDVGFPLQPRDGVDDLFQLYISLGQAF